MQEAEEVSSTTYSKYRETVCLVIRPQKLPFVHFLCTRITCTKVIQNRTCDSHETFCNDVGKVN